MGPNGQIIASMLHSLQVVNCSTGEAIKKISYEGFQPYAVQYYKGRVTVINYEKNGQSAADKDYIVVLDNNLAEMRRWETEEALDIAIMDDKVHLSDFHTGEIIVYDWNTREKIPQIIIKNGSARGLCQFFPSSLLFLDVKYNTVRKYKIKNRKFSLVWTQKVITPWVASVDENGLIWIRSNSFSTITIIIRSGLFITDYTI